MYKVNRERARAKGFFAATHEGQLRGEEGLHWLSSVLLEKDGERPLAAPELCVNTAWGGREEAEARLAALKHGCKKRVHLLALGDVGGTVLIGLKLLGGGCIERIGISDLDEKVLRRYEYEMNQVMWPQEYDRLPPVEIVTQKELFDCDVFVFCAAKSVPPVGASGQDMRMVQLAENAKIAAAFGRQAGAAGFRGIFAVVSDPVDQLCSAVFEAAQGALWPEQIQGFGLGVMNARAAYYAKKDARFASFLTEGRAFGPHGADLVIANSIEHYDDALSRELSVLTAEANLRVRETGFKPYIAPSLSSAAISLVLMMEGKWHYSSNFLGGAWMGSRNRTGREGLMIEHLPLPPALYRRIEAAYENLRV